MAPTTCGTAMRTNGTMLRVEGVDCDDVDNNVRPNQTESCNGVDDNCDGTVDEGVARTFYLDADGDGFGDAFQAPILSCPNDIPEGFVTDNGNLIVDVRGLSMVDAVALETRINQIVGIVSSGLFACRAADVCLLGTATGVQTLTAV
jgi:hypothetical protein